MSIPFNPITISIGKKSLSSFISLQIEQNIGKHHRFQMSVELESGGNRYVHNISENSKKWLGESIVVKAANKPIFVGVVTNVQLHREGSDFGCIIVSGYSATYRMETAHSCFSWNDTTIGNVVKKLCADAKVQLELNPAFKETKDFICQYEESDFDFIRRLAHQYQEWMYFDGTKLIFGKPRKLADGNLSEESLGDFIIIEITHEVSQGSYYKNRFKAIPATIKAMPSPKVRMPLSETQMATVLSNADPEGKGRVRVRMNWQTDGMQTSWVRVMTPDGGSSSDVKSNRARALPVAPAVP